MAKLFVIRGPSGVGKTTVAHAVYQLLRSEKRSVVHVHADVFFDDLDIKPDEATNKQMDLAFRNASCVVSNCLKFGYDVVFEGVLVDAQVNDMIAAERSQDDYKPDIMSIYLHADLKTVERRNMSRPKSGQGSAENIKNVYKSMDATVGKVDGEFEIDTRGMSVDEVANVILNSRQLCACLNGYEPCCPRRADA